MQSDSRKNLIILGNRIKQLRMEKSSSLNQFVFLNSELTSATWSRIENAKVDIKFSTLIKVASSLNIKIEDLIKDLDLIYNFED